MIQSVCTNPVYVQSMYRKETGVDRLTVSKCTDVCCMVCTLYIHTYFTTFFSEDRLSNSTYSVCTRGVLA